MAHLGARKWHFGCQNDDFEISLESGREVHELRRTEQIVGLADWQLGENWHFSVKVRQKCFRHFGGEGIEISP